MSTPLVSVAIPVFNGAATLAETLGSVLEQDLRDIEVVVVDDGSSDGSLDIVAGVSDPRIRVHRHRNAGLAANFNRCLEHAAGRYLKILPQDDVLERACLTRSVEALEACPDATLFFSRRTVDCATDDAWNRRWLEDYAELDAPLAPLGPCNDGAELLRRWDRASRITRNCVGEPACVLMSVAAAREAGGFNARLAQNLDFELFVKLMARGHVAFSAERLSRFRLHGENASRTGRSPFETLWLLESLASDERVCAILPGVRSALRREARRVCGTPVRRALFFWRRYADPDALLAGAARSGRAE